MIEGLPEDISRQTRFTFSRAGGPGGQHVNKVQTRVRGRLGIGSLTVLSEHQKDLLRRNLSTRVTGGDEVVVVVDQERSQARNREIALKRLTDLVVEATRERKPRIRTRTPRSVHERRLEHKRRRGRTKELRRRVGHDE